MVDEHLADPGLPYGLLQRFRTAQSVEVQADQKIGRFDSRGCGFRVGIGDKRIRSLQKELQGIRQGVGKNCHSILAPAGFEILDHGNAAAGRIPVGTHVANGGDD